MPYTIGLLAAGLVMAMMGIDTGIRLTPELLFDVLLPPLLFEAALQTPWRDLRADAAPVFVLATAGVVIAAVVVAIALYFLIFQPR